MTTFSGDIRYRNHCDKCGAKVGESTAGWSLNKYGAVFCWNCQPRTVKDETKKWAGRPVHTGKN